MMTAATLVAALSACGSDDADIDPVEIEVVDEDVGEPIDLDLPLDDSGAFEFDAWPNACELVGEEMIREIYPQTEDIAQSSSPRTITMIAIGEENQDVTVPAAECRTSVGLDLDGLRLSDQVEHIGFVSSVEWAGDPEFVERNAGDPIGDEVEVGDVTCYREVGRYTCDLDEISFAISFDVRMYAQYIPGMNEDEYLIDGEPLTVGEDRSAYDEMITERVHLPVLTNTLDRLEAGMP